MSDLLFCLIFIQVAIFFILGIILVASFYKNCKERSLTNARSALRARLQRIGIVRSITEPKRAGRLTQTL